MRWIIIALVAGTIAADLFAGITGTSLTFAAGLGLVYGGERLFAEDALRWVFTGAGLAVMVLAMGLRTRRMRHDVGTRREAQRKALVAGGVALAGLGLYGLSSESMVTMLGLADESATHWQGALRALTPIVVLAGLLPMFLLDRALSHHPMTLPSGATRRAINAGLTVALSLSLVFPLNYLANAHKAEWNYAYFKVTAPGTATLAIAKSLSEPIEAKLFYPPGSDVGREILPYFAALESASDSRFSFAVVDQAVEPKLAEALKIRENGYIVFQKGDAVEKFKLGTDMDKARRDLKKLDSLVQKNLLKVARGARNAYFLVGHGEASTKEKDDPLRKINLLKSALENQNTKVKNLGVAEGLTDAVPDDAAFVVIAAPEKPLLPEEESAIRAYLDRGGRLLALVEPGLEPLDGLLGTLGLRAGHAPLAHMSKIVTQTRGPADRVFLATNRFGSHDSVSTLSKNSSQLFVLMPTVTDLTEVPGGKGKATVVLRSFEETWADADGDRERGPAEQSAVFNVGYAISGAASGPAIGAVADAAAADAAGNQSEFRAIVLGDVSMFADPILQASAGNQQLVVDAIRWLMGDEAMAGTTESEEDVMIQHTREEDVAWFYGTIFGVPLLVLAAGITLTALRNRRAR